MATRARSSRCGGIFAASALTLGASPPSAGTAAEGAGALPSPRDLHYPGGEFVLGSGRDEPFVFDNEKWAHPVTIHPFNIARAPVTQAVGPQSGQMGAAGDEHGPDPGLVQVRSEGRPHRARADHDVAGHVAAMIAGSGPSRATLRLPHPSRRSPAARARAHRRHRTSDRSLRDVRSSQARAAVVDQAHDASGADA